MFSNLADELCVFGELGWIDSEMNFDNATYNADIARFDRYSKTASRTF